MAAARAIVKKSAPVPTGASRDNRRIRFRRVPTKRPETSITALGPSLSKLHPQFRKGTAHPCQREKTDKSLGISQRRLMEGTTETKARSDVPASGEGMQGAKRANHPKGKCRVAWPGFRAMCLRQGRRFISDSSVLYRRFIGDLWALRFHTLLWLQCIQPVDGSFDALRTFPKIRPQVSLLLKAILDGP